MAILDSTQQADDVTRQDVPVPLDDQAALADTIDFTNEGDPVVGYTPYFNPAEGGEVIDGEGTGYISGPGGGGGGGVLYGSSGGDWEATTREVQDEELTSYQMNKLLEQDGTYIRNARNRAAQLANKRGALSSSLFAGASQQAATEAALPIASADAVAFQQTARDNMQALNNMTLAMVQRATSIDTANISASAQIASSRIAAESASLVANIQRMTSIDTANISANSRISIANLNAEIQLRLQEMGDAGQMARLIEGQEGTFANNLVLQDLERDNANSLAQLNAYANLNNQYITLQTSLAGQKMSKAAAARAYAGIEDWFNSQIAILNKIYGSG